MDYKTLSNGVKMPILGFGVYQVPDLDECERVVSDAMSVGYRSIDTAQAYMNEEAVGNAIRKSGIAREEFFITTKIWISNYGYEKAKASLDASLDEYGVQIESWGPFAEGRNDFFTNETLVAIGQKYHKSAAQVALRYLIQRDIIVIPKTVHKNRMEQNFDVFDFVLTDDDMAEILKLDMGESQFFSHADPETVKMISSFKI